MDNFYEDGWLEQDYEDRHLIPDDDEFVGVLDYCEYCGEHWTVCDCEEDIDEEY